jgi:hypothetical protein
VTELERARKLATEMLMERLADDILDLEEFERRLDQVNAAATVEEIAGILGEVAASRRGIQVRASQLFGQLSRAADAAAMGVPALEPLRPAKGLRRIGRGNKVVLALQDGSGRVGPWTPARHVWVVNMLGGAVMDFREATLPSGVTELTVFCIMGDVEVIVPLDLQVEFGGLGLIGGFDCEPTVGVSNPDAPVLRINGVSCLGGVTVSVRDVGEDAPAPPPVPSRRQMTEPRAGTPRRSIEADRPRPSGRAGDSPVLPAPTPEKP